MKELKLNMYSSLQTKSFLYEGTKAKYVQFTSNKKLWVTNKVYTKMLFRLNLAKSKSHIRL